MSTSEQSRWIEERELICDQKAKSGASDGFATSGDQDALRAGRLAWLALLTAGSGVSHPTGDHNRAVPTAWVRTLAVDYETSR